MKQLYIKTVLPVIVFLSVILYINTLNNAFVYDDAYIIAKNHFITAFKNLPKIFSQDYFYGSGELSYRPVVTLTYFIDHAIWQLNPFGYHLTNVILHIINVALFFIFTKNIFKNYRLSFLATLLYSSHPVLTETVNAVCYREDILASVFFFLAFIFFLKTTRYYSREPKSRFIMFYVLSCFSYCIALFSKEMAITLPLLLVVYDFVCCERSKKTSLFSSPLLTKTRHILFYYAGYIFVTAFYLSMRFIVFKNTFKTIEVYPTSIAAMTKVVASYIKLLFLPVRLNADYYVATDQGYGLSFVLAVLMFISLFVIFIRIVRKNRTLAFFILWFFIALLPVLGIIPIGNIMAERYLYIPAAGVFCFISYSLKDFRFNKKNIFVIGIILVFLGIGVVQRNSVWKNDATLWYYTYQREPRSARACSNLGNAYFQKGHYEKAIKLFKRALRLEYSYPFIHYNLGVAYEESGMINKAIKEYKASLSKHHDNALAYYNLGTIYDKQGYHTRAIKAYKQALKNNPYKPSVHNNLGNTYESLGKTEMALREYAKAVEIDNGYADAHNNMGAVHLKKGNTDKAIQELKKAVQLKKDHRDAHYNLGIAYAAKGMHKKAARELRLSLKYNPEDYSACRDLGILFFKYKKDPNNSLHYLNKALELAPNDGERKKIKDIIAAVIAGKE